MILTEKTTLLITNRNYKYWVDKGSYDVERNQSLIVFVKDLKNNCHNKIEVKCDKCGDIKEITYQNYNKYTKNQTILYFCNHCNADRVKESFELRFGKGITNGMFVKEYREKQKTEVKKSMTKEVNDKRQQTNLERYGFNVPCKCKEIKEKLVNSHNSKTPDEISIINSKREQTLMKKYGVTNINKLDNILEKSKETRISNGMQVPDDQLTDIQIYRKRVSSITNKVKKKLFENWNGYDYYDGEYIENNLLLGKYNVNYPTIDHKNSVLYGFLNNIDPEIIGNIDNLCITKLTNNSHKNSKTFFIPK